MVFFYLKIMNLTRRTMFYSLPDPSNYRPTHHVHSAGVVEEVLVDLECDLDGAVRHDLLKNSVMMMQRYRNDLSTPNYNIL